MVLVAECELLNYQYDTMLAESSVPAGSVQCYCFRTNFSQYVAMSNITDLLTITKSCYFY
jgi:hypothetical protein